MSRTVVIELPDSAFAALRQDPAGMAGALRRAAAVKWYEMGWVSQERAAEIAGVSRVEFVTLLGRYGVSPFQVDEDELAPRSRDV